LLILQGNYEEALEYTKDILDNTKPPLNNIALVFKIMTYLSMEDKENFQVQLLAFEEFLKTYPIPSYKPYITAWNAQMTYWNGDIEKSLQQLDLAIEESKQSIVSLRSNSFVEQFILNKAELLLELGEIEAANNEVDFLLNRNPIYADAHYLKAQIYKLQGDSKNSILSLQQAKDIWKDADKDFVGLKKLNELD